MITQSLDDPRLLFLSVGIVHLKSLLPSISVHSAHSFLTTASSNPNASSIHHTASPSEHGSDKLKMPCKRTLVCSSNKIISLVHTFNKDSQIFISRTTSLPMYNY